MQTLQVQFSDSREVEIISYFGAPQDSGVYEHLGAIVADDARWLAYLKQLPESIRASLPAATSAPA